MGLNWSSEWSYSRTNSTAYKLAQTSVYIVQIRQVSRHISIRLQFNVCDRFFKKSYDKTGSLHWLLETLKNKINRVFLFQKKSWEYLMSNLVLRGTKTGLLCVSESTSKSLSPIRLHDVMSLEHLLLDALSWNIVHWKFSPSQTFWNELTV